MEELCFLRDEIILPVLDMTSTLESTICYFFHELVILGLSQSVHNQVIVVLVYVIFGSLMAWVLAL